MSLTARLYLQAYPTPSSSSGSGVDDDDYWSSLRAQDRHDRKQRSLTSTDIAGDSGIRSFKSGLYTRRRTVVIRFTTDHCLSNRCIKLWTVKTCTSSTASTAETSFVRYEPNPFLLLLLLLVLLLLFRLLILLVQQCGQLQYWTCSNIPLRQVDDHYTDSYYMPDMGMANVRSQTSSQPVSLVNCGTDLNPNHHQYSNKVIPGSGHMFFPEHAAANAYTQDLAGVYPQPQFQCASYPTDTIFHTGNVDAVYQQGMNSSIGVYPNMPTFAEPSELSHVSPANVNWSFSSSAGSSVDSEGMASMSLDSGPGSGRSPSSNYPSNRQAHTPSLQGQGWPTNCPATISPKMLRINPSPTPRSSSESVTPGIPPSLGETDMEAFALEEQRTRTALPTKCLGRKLGDANPSRHPERKVRRDLPSKPAKSRLARSPPREAIPYKGKAKIHPKPIQSSSLCPLEAAPTRTFSGPNLLEEEGGEVGIARGSSADAERINKDKYLVEMRRAGMPYRDIRKNGEYEEAESTLRGRFRTLTKAKSERVRKPEWTETDKRLLKQAVQIYASESGSVRSVSWKKVGVYIKDHGGSYHFGNATCRKKWDEMVSNGEEAC
ncbi:hypothetical protein F5Y17DRAFT_458441 [Xylariaceae sp. FL0594]|nr:hypothetical protein F5Y17DRAFT_458441 [Xylariaceae sp. FL0594]